MDRRLASLGADQAGKPDFGGAEGAEVIKRTGDAEDIQDTKDIEGAEQRLEYRPAVADGADRPSR